LNLSLLLNILARNEADAAGSLLAMSFRKEASVEGDAEEESPLLRNVEGLFAFATPAAGSILAAVAAAAAVDNASNECRGVCLL
jgi:hypothetical protein